MTRSRRITVASIAIGVALVVIIAGAIVLPRIMAQGGFGQALYEFQGVTKSASYSTASAIPSASKPSWFPSSANDIHTKVSGPKAKQKGHVLLDATVPATYALPSACSAGEAPFPWDDGWNNVDPRTASVCGKWSATIVDGRLYAWK